MLSISILLVFKVGDNDHITLTDTDPTTVVDASLTGWIAMATGSNSATTRTRKQQHIVQRKQFLYLCLTESPHRYKSYYGREIKDKKK